MLSLQFIRDNYKILEQTLNAKNVKIDLNKILNLDVQRRELIKEADTLKAQRNRVSQEISEKKKNKQSAENDIKNMRLVSESIKTLDEKLKNIINDLDELLLYIPNLLHNSVPIGSPPEDNVVIREWGKKISRDFKLKDHVEI